VLIEASRRYGIAERKFFEILEEKPRRWWVSWLESLGVYRDVLQAALCEFAQQGNLVYHGRAGQELLPGIRHVLNVFVDTPTESRIQQVKARKGLSEEAARQYLEELDRIRARRLKELFDIDWRDPARYDFVINTSRISVETAATMIAEVSQREEYRPTEESLEAIKDLTVNARVRAVLNTSADIRISNLELQTKCGEVYISGVLVGADIEKLIADTIKKIPGVTGVKTYFIVTPAEHSIYADGR
jgi:hypothetical protein